MNLENIVLNTFSNFSITLTPILIFLIISGQFSIKSELAKKIVLGAGLGCAAVLSALSPLTVSEGIILDFKHVLTALSTFLGGPVAGGITAGAALIHRALTGGVGAWAGSTSILFCGLAGWLFRSLFRRFPKINRSVTFVMLGLTAGSVELLTGFMILFLVHAEIILPLIREHFLPVIISNTVAMFCFGSLIAIIESRRQYQEQLAESEQRYSRFINLAPDGVLGIQRERIFFINKSAADMFGCDLKEIIGKKVLHFMAPEHRAAMRRFLQRRLESRDTVSVFESGILQPVGPLRDVEFSLGVMTHDNEAAVIAFVRDTSGRKRVEAEKAVLEDQLRQSQKMEAIGRLAGGIAHDFNNLLMVILGYVSILKETGGPAAHNGPELAEIEKAAVRAAELTRQLLAFSRKQTIQPVDLDVNEVIRGMSGMITRMIGEQIRFEFIEGVNLGTVFADKSQIEQVIMNLCVNARDALPRGGRFVIETENTELEESDAVSFVKAKPYVQLTFSDTGTGMDAETRANIFEPFFTTKEQEKGTGLGLATVYGIVRQHGGKIHVWSAPGFGSSFKLSFPRVDRPANAITEEVIPHVRGGNERILVTEDDESVLALVTRILKDAGYQVTGARDGREALALFKSPHKRFDLVILDLIMPGMTGDEVMREILKQKPEMCFIFSSGYSFNLINPEILERKRIELISKPYQPGRLLRTVRQTLDTRCGSSGRR